MGFRLKQVIVGVSVTLFIGIILAYAYYQSRAIIEGPTISVDNLSSGDSTTTPLIFIHGNVTYAKEITLQGRPIFVDLNGVFSEKLLLTEGYNIIEIVAKDAEGRVKKKDIEILLTPETVN